MKASDVCNLLIQSGLLGVFAGLAVTGLKHLKAIADAKTAEVTAKIKDANVKNAINSAEDCATTVVLELSQTSVEDLKAKSADGKLTAEDAAQIKADAVAKVQALLSDDVVNTLNTIYGDGQAWLSSKIEAAVKKLKASATQNTSKATPVPATTPTPVATIPIQ